MEPCKTSLESLLDQAIGKFKLRNILSAYGIPSDEIVEIELSTENRVIATCSIPLGDSKASFEGSSAPLPRLRDQMQVFFDNAQETFKLLKQIEANKAPSSLFKVTFLIGTKLVGEEKIPEIVLFSYHGVLNPCPPSTDPDSYCTV